MKSRILFTICFIAYHSIFSQTNTGISVQGIARDANKAALVDELLTFTFEIMEDGGGTSYYKEDVDITTDLYGVFSHIIGTGSVLAGSGNFNEIPFGLTHMKLVISVNYGGSDIVISDAPFQYTPYAKSAENGVPTGTIVAFAGQEGDMPLGWTLCDGRALNTVTGSANLEALIGANAPDLQGMFLRGTGTSPVNSQAGPALGDTQGDSNKVHNHTGSSGTDGSHDHTYIPSEGNNNANPPNKRGSSVGDGNLDSITPGTALDTGLDGNHTHTVTINNSTGTDESRPVNYGVNYIIKL